MSKREKFGQGKQFGIFGNTNAIMFFCELIENIQFHEDLLETQPYPVTVYFKIYAAF